jgi:DNA-binding CsgD family transcriptional regulator
MPSRSRPRIAAHGLAFAKACRFVDAAAEFCTDATARGLQGAGVLLHRESGPPALGVDNFPALSDAARIEAVSRQNCIKNPQSDELSHPQIGPLIVTAPLLGASGWFGTAVFGHVAQPDVALERELSLLVTQLSVWCTAHGVGRLPDLPGPELPARQHQVARLAASGKTNGEIGNELGISVNTVKLRLKQVFERLHLNNRTELSNTLRRLAPLEGIAIGVTHIGAIAITRAAL